MHDNTGGASVSKSMCRMWPGHRTKSIHVYNTGTVIQAYSSQADFWCDLSFDWANFSPGQLISLAVK